MRKVIYINAVEAQQFQKWLDSNQPVPNASKHEKLVSYTANFGGGYEVDIDIMNTTSGPYINAVLFCEGCEVDFLDAKYTLLGEYKFSGGYEVSLELAHDRHNKTP